jgi:F0F1-type ATP synthase assembly protein I
VAILIAAGGGYWLDTRFDTSPILLIVGTILGFTAFVVRLLRLGREQQKPPQDPG